jgi:hypothetical protein
MLSSFLTLIFTNTILEKSCSARMGDGPGDLGRLGAERVREAILLEPQFLHPQCGLCAQRGLDLATPCGLQALRLNPELSAVS